MDVRIGVTQAPRELNIELAEDADRDDLKARVEAALAGASDVLWITDKRGKDVAIPSAILFICSKEENCANWAIKSSSSIGDNGS